MLLLSKMKTWSLLSSIIIFAILVFIATLLPSVGDAHSNPQVPKSGRWGDPGPDPLGFKVRGCTVTNFRAFVALSCHNTDTNEDYNIEFDTGLDTAPNFHIRRVGRHYARLQIMVVADLYVLESLFVVINEPQSLSKPHLAAASRFAPGTKLTNQSLPSA